MVSAPEPLTDQHNTELFNSTEEVLNIWLKHSALDNETGGASRTYVICEDDRVVGYYCLATSAVTRSQATGRVRRAMPEPIPMMLLGRLAVDRAYKGQGYGTGLLRDAIFRTLQAAQIAGIRGLFVHAMSPEAKRFYEKHGFQESPGNPMLLMVALKDVMASVK